MTSPSSAKRRKASSAYAYTQRRLASGLSLVTVHQPHLHRGSIAVYFRTGSRYETPENNGISHFLEHMVFRGNKAFPSAHALNLAAECIGGTLFAATAPDSTEFELTLPTESLAEGARLLAHTVATPRFGDIEIERKVITEEIREELNEHDESIDVDHLSRRKLWPDHPLGQSVLGPVENATRVQTDQLRRHLSEHYVAGNAVVSLTGAFDPVRDVEAVAEAFELLPSAPVERREPPVTLGVGPQSTYQRRTGSQTHVRLAFHAPGDDSPDRAALGILLGILDDGMSTRLHRRIFDELGLAYHVAAEMDSYPDAAALNVDATTSHENVPRIVEELMRLLVELRDGPIDDVEIDKAIRRSVWAVDGFYDDPHAMSGWYGEQSLFRVPQMIEAHAAELQRVTRSDIERVARRIFTPDRLVLTTIGAADATTRKRLDRLVSRFPAPLSP